MRVPRLSLLRAAFLGSLAIVAACAGCAREMTAIPGAGEAYPGGLDRTRTLNAQVFLRDDKQILELTNTTARSYGASRLWVNQWFSAPIDGLGIGQTLRIPVERLKDEYGESFKGGGFFAIEAPDELLLAELETEGRLLGLIVVEQAAR